MVVVSRPSDERYHRQSHKHKAGINTAPRIDSPHTVSVVCMVNTTTHGSALEDIRGTGPNAGGPTGTHTPIVCLTFPLE